MLYATIVDIIRWPREKQISLTGEKHLGKKDQLQEIDLFRKV